MSPVRMSSETVYPLPGDFAVMSLEGAIISVSVFRVDKKVMSVWSECIVVMQLNLHPSHALVQLVRDKLLGDLERKGALSVIEARNKNGKQNLPLSPQLVHPVVCLWVQSKYSPFKFTSSKFIIQQEIMLQNTVWWKLWYSKSTLADSFKSNNFDRIMRGLKMIFDLKWSGDPCLIFEQDLSQNTSIPRLGPALSHLVNYSYVNISI